MSEEDSRKRQQNQEINSSITNKRGIERMKNN